MKYKNKYIILVFILSLVMNMGIMAQGSHVGSWIVSSSYYTYSVDDDDGYVNYQLRFTKDGVISWEELSTSGNVSDHYDFAFSMGAYTACDGEMETYVTGKHNYDIQEDWVSNRSFLYTDAQIIASSFDDNKYQMLFGGKYDPTDNWNLFYTDIDTENNLPTFTTSFFPFVGGNNAYRAAFAMTNIIDEDRFIYTVTTQSFNFNSEDFGLEKYIFTNDGFSHVETLILDSDNNNFNPVDYMGYNLEIQDKNNIVNPKIAWITTPISDSINDRILINDDNVTNNHYALDLGQIGTGYIA